MKKAVSLILVLVLALSLVTCGAGAAEADAAGAYYSYLKEVLLPEYGLAGIGSRDWTVPDLFSSSNGTLADIMSGYRDDETGEGGHGILSAVVRDMDGDGAQDLLVLFLDKEAGESTAVRTVYGSENVTVLRARLYTMPNGDAASIQQADYAPVLAEIGGLCRGTMLAGIALEGGVPYLYTYEWMEDATTYGPFLTRVYHVENGSFVLDSADGWIGWGQSMDVDDVNAFCGAVGVSFAGTGVEAAYQLAAAGDRSLSIEEDPNLSQVGDSLLTRLVFSWTPGVSQGITTSIEERTNLRAALESGPEAAAAASESAAVVPVRSISPDVDSRLISFYHTADSTYIMAAVRDPQGKYQYGGFFAGGENVGFRTVNHGDWLVAFTLVNGTGWQLGDLYLHLGGVGDVQERDYTFTEADMASPEEYPELGLFPMNGHTVLIGQSIEYSYDTTPPSLALKVLVCDPGMVDQGTKLTRDEIPVDAFRLYAGDGTPAEEFFGAPCETSIMVSSAEIDYFTIAYISLKYAPCEDAGERGDRVSTAPKMREYLLETAPYFTYTDPEGNVFKFPLDYNDIPAMYR